MAGIQASFRNSIVNPPPCSSFKNDLLIFYLERAFGNAVKECLVTTLSETRLLFSNLQVANHRCRKADSRLLPNLAKHVVLTMLYNREPVAVVDFVTWFANDSASKMLPFQRMLC
jgi:hypothetical protein